MNKQHRELSRFLATLPVQAELETETHRKHPRVILKHQGHQRIVTFARSPGDYRSMRNVEGDIKRTVRQLLELPIPNLPPQEKPVTANNVHLHSTPHVSEDKSAKPTPKDDPYYNEAKAWVARLQKAFHKSEQPVASIEIITPNIAGYLLDNNPDNRNIVQSRVKDFQSDIAGGRWVMNGESIIIANTGELNDGQHRLWAIVESGLPITTLVVYGVPREARTTTDMGTARTIRDVLTMEQVPNALQAGAIAGYLFRMENGIGLDARGKGAVGVTKQVILAHFKEHVDEVQWGLTVANLGSKAAAKMTGSLSLVAFTSIIFARVAGRAAVELFWTEFRSGAGLTEHSPILYARNRLSTDKHLSFSARAEVLCKTWNLWREGKDAGAYMKTTGSLPELK